MINLSTGAFYERAEEKANSLPVRMVLPLGLCVFPVVMMIVMLPVIIRMKGVFF